MIKRRGHYKEMNKLGQVTIFVIIAIVIVVGVAGFFAVRNNLFNLFSSMPKDFVPVYDYYTSCVQEVVKDGANTMASQAGYLYSPDFYPGSEYSPFSSQLEFMGLGVPYWYYISANGIKKEQIPSINQMNNELGRYVKDELKRKCSLADFENQGFIIEIEDVSSAKADIRETKIYTDFNQRIIIKKGEESFVLSSHRIEVGSNLGKFYNTAKKIYDYEKKNSFLENYSVDVLYTYAPVSGVELGCSPKVWSPYEVIDRLKKALEANIGALKVNGNYYTTNNQKDNYFIVGKDGGLKVDNEQVNFVYSRNFPGRFEVWPTKNNLMVADPIGNQPGLNAMGFCYVPYKFVYDMYFPVLIQIYNKDDLNAEEVFEFPVAIVIDKNVGREAISSDYIESIETICDKANTDLTVNTYNVNLEPIAAEIEFKCITDVCDLGNTNISNSTSIFSLNARVPQCVNGVLIAKAEGYKDKKYVISTNEENTADIILDKQYTLALEVYVDGSLSNDISVLSVNENSDQGVEGFVDSVSYPTIKEIKLAEGDYNFKLIVYKKGSLVIPGTTTKQCVKQPKTGIFGLFGAEEKCYDITVPSQTISNLPIAGGSVNQYITPSELENAKVLRIYAESEDIPANINEMQISYDDLEYKNIELAFA